MNKIYTLLLLSTVLQVSCTKEFLDKKPNKALVVPSSLENFHAILDNSFNVFGVTPFMNQIADGDFYVNDAGIQALANLTRNVYLWQNDIYEGATSADWNKMYQQIFYANIVLEGLNDIKKDNLYAGRVDQLRGTALFCRAYALYNLAQQFTMPYDARTASMAMGLPLRKNANVDIKPERSSLQDTYQSILDDIKQAELLLPVAIEPKSRPTKAAAWALLARVCLSMEDYETALNAASNALTFQNDLMDFNELDLGAASPFPAGRSVYNKEIIYYTDRITNTFFNSANTRVVGDLYRAYDDHDLRKRAFFNNGRFKGSYGGGPLFIFTGLATDELYLTRAECYARLGQLSLALDDLKLLMKSRWISGTDYPLPQTEDRDEILGLILTERRKELITRGTRWADLRRLNKDERFSITLKRTFRENEYILYPNDKRYAFPIALDEIDLGNIEQNDR